MEKYRNQSFSEYQNQVHRFGRISSLIAAGAMLTVPIVLTLFFWEIKLDVGPTMQSYFGLAILFTTLAFTDFVTYPPLIGAGATYLSFITGNLINIKLPAVMSSITLTGYEPDSKETEVISTLAVAVSSLVTISIVTLGMISLSFIIGPLQSPELKPAYDNLMPAVLGALAAPYLIKDLKTAMFPGAVAAIITLALGYTVFSKLQALSIPIFAIIAIGWRYVLYRFEQKGISKSEKAVL